MQLTIEIPEIVCCRCSKTAGVVPVMLKRGSGANAITDSMGNTWMQSGAVFPVGWTQAPTDATKSMCADCSTIVAAKIDELLSPPKPEPEPPQVPGVSKHLSAPVHSARSTGIPSRVIPAPVIARTLVSSVQASKPVHATMPSVTRPAPPASRPNVITTATLPKVQPSTVRQPVAPVGVQAAVTQPTQVIGPSTVRQPIAPAQATKLEPTVAQVHYPSTEAKKPAVAAPVHVEKPEFVVQKNTSDGKPTAA